MIFHAAVFSSCAVVAWLLRFEFTIRPEWLATFRSSLLLVVGVQLVAGLVFGFYRMWWRYVGIADVINVVSGMTVALGVLMTLWYIGPRLGIPAHYVKAPRGVLMIDWAFAVLTLFGSRVGMRLTQQRLRPAERVDAKRVVIVGAGDAGETLAREIGNRPQLGMKVVAFVDDQRAKWNCQIRGIRVFGPIANIGSIASALNADEALIAIPSASGKRMREIIDHLSRASLNFKTIPGIDHLVSGKVHVSQLRPVNIEDLLRRKRIELPGDPVRHMLRGRRVLVTGAGGTIGSELAVQIAAFEPERLALVERSEFALYECRKRLGRVDVPNGPQITSNLVDICDTDIIEELIARERPDVVLHAAAHKHVPLGEENPSEYLRNNCLATRTLAEICEAHGVSTFVLVSTDKAINPSSVMGATKRAAEIALLDVARRSNMKPTIVRFGNVLGSSGSAVPLFLEQIAAGGPVTVTHPDVTRYFIRTSEAISLVLQAAALGDSGCVFMLDMGEPVKIVDLARNLIQLSNKNESEIPIVFTGLRPGEKLFEEIRLKGESIRPTVHPQIVVTEAPQPDEIQVTRWLAAAARVRDAEKTVAALMDLIPEYNPGEHRAAAKTRTEARTDSAMALPTLLSAERAV